MITKVKLIDISSPCIVAFFFLLVMRAPETSSFGRVFHGAIDLELKTGSSYMTAALLFAQRLSSPTSLLLVTILLSASVYLTFLESTYK